MARPRSFDEERALDAAMHAFWVNGYEATSTQDLCEATGLGRSSIYNTFTSKHDLFRRSLTRYMETMNAGQTEILEDAELSATERVRALLARVIEGDLEQRENGHSIGCLTVNTTVELAGRDPEAAGMLERDLAARLTVLRATIRTGQLDGDITTERDADTLARFVNAIIGGMRVSAQAGADRAALRAIAETALDALAVR
ncbi:TetR/AcrR family transcriptional regulator [Streptomyces sp. NPDC046465]|uniref:TetR/AcrR family transcriptional regulator n=1 Tax=Streptomyces sp. NPDC046465 TaxID=3155810 RepID=UPI0033E15FD9